MHTNFFPIWVTGIRPNCPKIEGNCSYQIEYWTSTRTDNSIAEHRRNLRLNFLFLEMWVSVRACVYGGGIGKKVNEVVG